MLRCWPLQGPEPAEFAPSSFFSEQLSAFELWLAHGSQEKRPPEQLPIVLQVLLSQVHRLRALVLLARFLDMGSWAVDLALSVGIFPYVLKLLQASGLPEHCKSQHDEALGTLHTQIRHACQSLWMVQC